MPIIASNSQKGQVFQLQGVESREYDVSLQNLRSPPFWIISTSNFISIHSPSTYKLSMIRFVHPHLDSTQTLRSFNVIILKKKKKKKKNNFDTGKRTIVYCRCTCHRHTLVFGIRKAWPSPFGDREIDGLTKASMAELLVTKQDPNSYDRVKSPQIWRHYLWTTEILLTWTLYRNSCRGLEVKRGVKSNSVRSGQPTYEACDDNLGARI